MDNLTILFPVVHLLCFFPLLQNIYNFHYEVYRLVEKALNTHFLQLWKSCISLFCLLSIVRLAEKTAEEQIVHLLISYLDVSEVLLQVIEKYCICPTSWVYCVIHKGICVICCYNLCIVKVVSALEKMVLFTTWCRVQMVVFLFQSLLA